MVSETWDGYWRDAHRRIDEGDLAQLCSLTVAEIAELVEYGGLVPLVDEGGNGRQFSAACVGPLREAVRLRGLYDLDLFTVSLLLGYLQRIAHLEQQLHHLQTHPPHPQVLPREGPTPWREPHA